MVQAFGTQTKRITLLAALLLATGLAHADVIAGDGPGAGPDKTVKAGGKEKQKGGVNVAAGDINGDGKDAPRKPLPLTPIAKSPLDPRPIRKPGIDPIGPKPLPKPGTGPIVKAPPGESPIGPKPRPTLDPKPLPTTPVTQVKAPGQKPQPLLVPAVQKIREAAPRPK